MSYEPIHVSLNTMFSAVSMGSNQTSSALNLDGIKHYCLQVVWSGASAADGTISLQVSNDRTNYDTIPDSVLAVSGASGIITINVDEPAYKHVRVVYTRVASPDGSMSATINCKR